VGFTNVRKAVKITLITLVSLSVVVAGLFIFLESDAFKVILFDMAAERIVIPEGFTFKAPGTEGDDSETGQAAQGDETGEGTDNPGKPANSGPDMSKFSRVTKMASSEDKARVIGILLGLLTPEEKMRFAKYASSGMTAEQQNELAGIFYSRISDGEYQELLYLYNKYAQQIE